MRTSLADHLVQARFKDRDMTFGQFGDPREVFIDAGDVVT